MDRDAALLISAAAAAAHESEMTTEGAGSEAHESPRSAGKGKARPPCRAPVSSPDPLPGLGRAARSGRRPPERKKACEQCHRAKAACEGSLPCRRCARLKMECCFPDKGKRLRESAEMRAQAAREHKRRMALTQVRPRPDHHSYFAPASQAQQPALFLAAMLPAPSACPPPAPSNELPQAVQMPGGMLAPTQQQQQHACLYLPVEMVPGGQGLVAVIPPAGAAAPGPGGPGQLSAHVSSQAMASQSPRSQFASPAAPQQQLMLLQPQQVQMAPQPQLQQPQHQSFSQQMAPQPQLQQPQHQSFSQQMAPQPQLQQPQHQSFSQQMAPQPQLQQH